MINHELEHPSIDELRLRRNIGVHALKMTLIEITCKTSYTPEEACVLAGKYVFYQFETARASLDLIQEAHSEKKKAEFNDKTTLVMNYVKFSYLMHDIREGNHDFVKEVLKDTGELFNEYGNDVLGDGMLRLVNAIPQHSLPVSFPPVPWEDMRVIKDYSKSKVQY